MKGRVLIIAGSDPSGGAGIQADIKTVTALGGYAATAITALTVQNTLGVTAIRPVDADFVIDQMRAVLDDIGAEVVKIGMLGDVTLIEKVSEVLGDYRRKAPLPIVLDPVMVAKGGHRLVPDDALNALRRSLMPMADVLTPNVPEAEALSGLQIQDFEQMHHAAEMLLTLGARAVLLKGGHLDTDPVRDLLVSQASDKGFESPRVNTRHTHGTGCTLASAVAAGLAQGLTLQAAVMRARNYVYHAIRSNPGLGKGRGPLNHAQAGRAVS